MKLLDILLAMPMSRLDNIGKNVGFDGMSTLNKKELAEALADTLPPMVKPLVESMDEHQYEVIEEAINENGRVFFFPGMFNKKRFEELGLLFPVREGRKTSLVMPTEIMEACKAVPTPDVELHSEIYGCLKGMLTHYGVIPIDKAHKIIEEIVGQEIDNKFFLYFSEMAGEYYRTFYKHDRYFVNALVEDEEELISIHEKRGDLEYKVFSKEVLMKYSQKDYLYMTPNLCRLEDFLCTGYDVYLEQVQEMLRMVTALSRLGHDLDILEECILEMIEVETEQEYRELIHLLTDIIITTPSWILKGYTLLDLSGKTTL